MKKTAVIATLSLLLGVGLAYAQSAEEMAAYMELAKPGDPHRMLHKVVGTWDASTTVWMAPGAPATTSNGTMTAESMLDGRFVKRTWEGKVMGMPFTGVGIDGYNNATKRYTSVWMDTMGTMTMIFDGQCTDETCNTLAMTSQFNDPVADAEMTLKMNTTWVNDNEFTSVSHMVMPDGSEFKTMEIVATRR